MSPFSCRVLHHEAAEAQNRGIMTRTPPFTPGQDSSDGDLRYHSLFEGIPLGLYITTPGGRILDANPALVHMLGYASKEGLLGVMASDLYVDPSDRDRQNLLFEDAAMVRKYETRLRRLDGQTIWVRDTCRAIRDGAGCIVRFEGSLQDVTEEKEAEQKLLYMARHDPLTGLLNRYALAELLEQETLRARRYKHPIGVLMVDVNRLKDVNDGFGHATGDQVLQLVAKALTSSVRETDYVVRYGGDEFLLLLLETNGETRIVRQRILDSMKDHNPVHLLIDFPVTLSIGIAHWIPDSGVSMESVLSLADASMYEDKRSHSSREFDSSRK
jgi:diguanylate cyclase (GGDEF)-like protein/PAS domain S-box-containing protein